MTVADATRNQRPIHKESRTESDPERTRSRSASETGRALTWMAVALAARAALAARIEGLLDHDQAVVGLMALDVSRMQRWPIFFDGQRYMGALEAYTAAVFVAFFGHSPTVVAMAPVFYFGLFVAGQYLLWSRWSGRATGHLAALLTVVSAPMAAFWTVIPRGGYVECLTWAIPVLGLYRDLTRPGAAPLSKAGQFGWGFLLALGYFLNPLSLIVYATLALDWTFGRHGADLRRLRGRSRRWLDSPWAPLIELGFGLILVVVLALGCHVGPDPFHNDRVRFLFLLDPDPTSLKVGMGLAVVAMALGLSAWWTGAAGRLFALASSRIWFMLGAMSALSPFPLHGLRVRLGLAPPDLSLPIWIRAPWAIGVNLRDGAQALGPLIGSNARGLDTSLVGQGIVMPPAAMPGLARFLAVVSPLVVALVLSLVATVAWRDRGAWRAVWSLRGDRPTPPTVLALTGLAVATGLYLLQASSVDCSSVRYLVPVWIVLPGLVASGLLIWPVRARVGALALLVGLWGTSQVNLWADMDRPSPVRPLAEDLRQRGVRGIVAPTPVALLVAELTSGQVGAVEYHSTWPRLRDRYADRFKPGEPVVCVVDTNLHGPPTTEDLVGQLHALARLYPDRVGLDRRIGAFEIWHADLPLAEILTPAFDPLHDRPGAGTITARGPTEPEP